MTTLADLTRRVARLITRTVIGSATTSPGNATSLVDTVNLVGYPDDQFNGGTIWLTSGANAGRSRAITDFTDSSDTLTFAAFPANITSGMEYEAADSRFVTYQDLRQAVNLALLEIGRILAWDDTTTIVDDQLVYTLPAGVSRVYQVYILEDPAATDEKPKIVSHWDEREGDLVFEYGREPSTIDGTKIRIVYKAWHADLVDDTDTLDGQIDDEYLIYLAARQAMRLAYKRFGKAGDDNIPEWLNEAIEEAKRHVRQKLHEPYVRIRTA